MNGSEAPEQYTGITYVVPCGGVKLDHAAPAGRLYVGSMFRHTYENATRSAELDTAAGLGPARVLILSALHGLVDPGTVLEPYNLKMGQPGSVTVDQLTEQARTFGIDWGSPVYALLPRPYLARLDQALRTLDVYAQDVYEACGGNGEQKRVNVHVGRPDAPPTVPAGPGPIVWLGGDVHTFTWGVPILVSYGRLRKATGTLPAAAAPWVCDSRAFSELAEHGRWTIPAPAYAADVDRYADEIGHLEWAAPQDWPITAELLAKTGLTEREHQARTVASVIELRALVGPKVRIIAVVSGLTTAGYLRHIGMYRAAGIDLHAETTVVGVGSLVGRTPQDVANIIRSLYAAGLHRLHGFGVKGRPLDLIGPLLESIDSAAWSTEARRRGGLCPHHLVTWERNCPTAAIEWGQAQRERGAGVHTQEMLPFDLIGV